MHFPVKTVRNINVFSDTSVGPTALKRIAENKISLTVFDKRGCIIGRFTPEHHRARAETFLAQTALYIDKKQRFELAKIFVQTEIFNLRANLRYYKKHSEAQTITKAINKLIDCMKELKTVPDYEKLLLSEARARLEYFSCLNDIMPDDDFYFDTRTRRPPKDAINALISFGNTVLYNYISNQIQKTSLDVKIGYLHATGKRAESLNLDIAEIYKPIIVDRVIFTLVNKHMINEKYHFDLTDNGGIHLTPEGKSIFLTRFYEKLNSSLTVQNVSKTYKELIMDDIFALQRYINGADNNFKPFRYIL